LTITFSYIALLFNSLNIKVMARVWVEGYTKKDGTKVPGHYRSSLSGKMTALKKEWDKANARHSAAWRNPSGKMSKISKYAKAGYTEGQARARKYKKKLSKKLDRLIRVQTRMRGF